MTRFLTSLVLLAATLAPAQAGLFDWANGDSATNLTGTGAPSAYFQVAQKDSNSTLDQNDWILQDGDRFFQTSAPFLEHDRYKSLRTSWDQNTVARK